MAEKRPPGLIRKYIRRFLASMGLMIFPLPIGMFRRQLAGKHVEGGDLEFYSHPNFVCTMHLIWVGWLVTLGELIRPYFIDKDATQEELQAANALWSAFLSWPWLFVLTVTIIVMGLQFARVAVGFLISAIVITGLGLWLIQSLSDIEVFKQIWSVIDKVPVLVEWGVPMVVSLALGIIFVCVATWRRMNDRWILKPRGNYLEHENFQERDRTISKGAKTFVAVFPCLLRRYLLFGFGNIEVRSSTGSTIIDRIEGVFFARHHSDVIKYRFGTTDVAMDAEEEEAEEEEAAADEAL